MTSDQTPKEITVFESLAPFEKSLLILISIIYEPVSLTFLLHTLSKAESVVQELHTPSKDELLAILIRLRQLKLIDAKNRCPQPLVEYITRKSLDGGVTFSALAGLVEREAPVSYMYGKWTTRCWRAMRQFRIGVYSGDFDKIDESLKFLEEHCIERLDNKSPAVIVAAEAFDSHWFGGLPGSMQFFLLDKILRYSIANLHHYQPVIEYLEDESALTVSVDEQVPFHRMLAGYLILQGRFDDLQRLLDRHGESFQGSGFSGTLAFLKGDTAKALLLYAGELKQLGDFFGDKNTFFFGLPGLFCVFALLTRNREEDRKAIKRHVVSVLTKFKGCPEEVPFRFIEAVVSSRDIGMPDMMVLTEHLKADDRSLTRFIALLCLYWMEVEIPDDFKESLMELHRKSRENNFAWLSMETAYLLHKLGGKDENYKKTSDQLSRQLGCSSIVGIIETEESWKHSLQELITLTSAVREQEKNTRLVWMVNYVKGSLQILPKEQKRKTSGEWSKGRSISLSRLADHMKLDFLSTQDRKICASLKEENNSAKSSGYVFDPDIALPALIGHPYVFLEKSPQTPVEIVAGEPELLVEQQDEYLFINFTQDIGEGNIAVWQETPTRFKVIMIDDNHRRVAAITGRKGLRVPTSASKQVLEAIGQIASFMTVHSSVGVDIQGHSVEMIDADPTIHLHFIPYGSGFRLEMFVQPFSKGGPYLKPGAGVANIMAEVNGKRLQTCRNLKLEEEKAREIEESCPILDLAIDLEQENER
ncbi:MAG: ATP-dependent helicase, partial [Desulfobulbaceae bacterium]|nr:ATP-dependent helicase [Desulfobulbaceae bacterium]